MAVTAAVSALVLTVAGLAFVVSHMSRANRADATDQVYLDRLASVGISIEDRSAALRDAHKVCDMLAGRSTFLDAARHVKEVNPGLDEVGSTYVVVLSNETLCPYSSPFRQRA